MDIDRRREIFKGVVFDDDRLVVSHALVASAAATSGADNDPMDEKRIHTYHLKCRDYPDGYAELLSLLGCSRSGFHSADLWVGQTPTDAMDYWTRGFEVVPWRDETWLAYGGRLSRLTQKQQGLLWELLCLDGLHRTWWRSKLASPTYLET